MEKDIATAFIHLFRHFKQQMQQVVKNLDIGITFFHFIALKEISLVERCTPQVLAETLCRDKAQITRLLKEFIDKGLVDKQPNPADKRSQYLFLTDQGLERLRMIEEAEQQLFAQMMKQIPVTDMQDWQVVTQLMSQNLMTMQQ